jgi:hypothetical protein
MKKFKFTLIQKQYYDQEIEAENYAEASEIFNNMIYTGELFRNDPNELGTDQYFEELKSEVTS